MPDHKTWRCGDLLDPSDAGTADPPKDQTVGSDTGSRSGGGPGIVQCYPEAAGCENTSL